MKLNAHQKSGIASVAAFTLLAIIIVVVISLKPGSYFFYNNEDRALWSHPTLYVLVICGIFLLEGAFTCLVLFSTSPKQLWARCCLGSILFVPWAMFSTLFVVHAPVFLHFHILWVWSIVLLFLVSFLGSLAKSIFRV